MDAFAEGLGARDFQRLSRFIERSSGIRMPAGKRTMLEGRLRRRLRATGIATLADYCDYLFANGGLEREAVFLIDAVTTNKTDFFREPAHFDVLRDMVLPELRGRGHVCLRAWSAACSTGPEPYSMAMVLDDFASAHGPLDFFVLATDLSTDVLRIAQKGIYPTDLLAPAPEALKRRYLRRSSKDRTRLRIAPALRAKVGFARLNFMDDAYPVGEPMQIIFCRNALIYFDKPTQARVLERLCACLEPGGYLFIGHSESVTGFDLPLAAVANTVFQRL
jgi:chemotaxis protein methyltransferase CheR